MGIYIGNIVVGNSGYFIKFISADFIASSIPLLLCKQQTPLIIYDKSYIIMEHAILQNDAKMEIKNNIVFISKKIELVEIWILI